MQPRSAVLPPPAFAELYEAELAYVWRLLRRLGVDAPDLEDAAHDVFLVVHRRLDTFDPRRHVRPWLAGIAFRVVSDRRRRARRRPEIPASDQPGPADLRDAAQRTEARELVLRALESLELDRRAVLVLHEIEGHAMPELAEALEVSVNTLYSRLRLARRDFAAAVRRLTEGEEP